MRIAPLTAACQDIIGNILRTRRFRASTSPSAIPHAEQTGQSWISKTHIDCVGRDFDIWFDDEQVMKRGKFLV